MQHPSRINMDNRKKNSTTRSKTYSFGLIGYPLDHSYSPKIHEAAFKALNINGEYNLYQVEPSNSGKKMLEYLLNQIRQQQITGVNITIPHKQNVLTHLDQLTDTAKQVGAVNTIFLSEGQLTGDNTDALGFWRDLQKVFPGLIRKNSSKTHKALILGAGGSARAVAYMLLNNDFNLIIAARNVNQARLLREHFTHYSERIDILPLNHKLERVSELLLIINATPVGMHPNIGDSPWPQEIPFPPGAYLYDLIYHPRETRFMKLAKHAGLKTASGLGMLVEQAALSFERWTSLQAPRKAMSNALLQE